MRDRTKISKAEWFRTSRTSLKVPSGRLLLALLAVVVFFVIMTSANAGGVKLQFFPGVNRVTEIHATRATVISALESPSPNVNYEVAYSTGSSGPWILFESGVAPGIGRSGGSGYTVDLHSLGHNPIRRLSPQTHYYVKIMVEDEEKERIEEVIDFTTNAIEPPEVTGLGVDEKNGATFAIAKAHIETNGAETEYHVEYAPSETGPYAPFTSSATGKVTVSEEQTDPSAEVTGLMPETTYYFRVIASNGHTPNASRVVKFVTRPVHPEASSNGVRRITETSVRLSGDVIPDGYETHWRFEYALAENGRAPASTSSSWLPGPGDEGVIPAGEADFERHAVVATLSGLSPATVYYVRLHAENGHEPAATSSVRGFETAGPPEAVTLATHAIHGETMRALGWVKPRGSDEEQVVRIGGTASGGSFKLSFSGQDTAAIVFEEGSEQNAVRVQGALEALPAIGAGNVEVADEGHAFRVSFVGVKAGLDQPQMTVDGSGLTPATTATVETLQDGVSYTTDYWTEYVSQEEFEQDGFSHAQRTPATDLGAGKIRGEGQVMGFAVKIVGVDLPTLRSGITYHYRLAAATSAPGAPSVYGAEQTLTTPTLPATGDEGSRCPNQALREGPSARLPDCRAFEQVTPIEKEGTEDIFTYPNTSSGALVGEDGEHVMVHAAGTQWGKSPDSSQSNYFFTREPRNGWRMVSGTPQNAGENGYHPAVFGSDLTQVGMEVGWATTPVSESANAELQAGPPGGPYKTVVAAPRTFPTQWVAGSADGSKLVLRTTDRSLVPTAPSATVSGFDLYEYSGETLRQLNVNSDGSPIGSCGASMPIGSAEQASLASRHAVSAEGARVYFEATPGTNCNAQKHLYVRIGGTETVDLGEYAFIAADAEGTKILLGKNAGQSTEVLIYEAGTSGSPKKLFSVSEQLTGVTVPADLSAVYFSSKERLTSDAPPLTSEIFAEENIYRFDIGTGTMSFLYQGDSASTTPNGRYLYFAGGGGIANGISGVPGGKGRAGQVYRYDLLERAIECVSCASPFDPEPKQAAVFAQAIDVAAPNGVPSPLSFSGNGNFVFFDTAAALLPQDVDGEAEPGNSEPSTGEYSVSSDIYEWRAPGVDGCAHLQGCLSLITTGSGGLENILLGSAHEGRDVFFATHEPLVAQDRDTAGDVYDARAEGGFPPPSPRPVECEGDACSTPLPLPNDQTPSSLTFQGAGNQLPAHVKTVVTRKHPRKKTNRRKPGKRKKARRTRRITHARLEANQPDSTDTGRRASRVVIAGGRQVGVGR